MTHLQWQHLGHPNRPRTKPLRITQHTASPAATHSPADPSAPSAARKLTTLTTSRSVTFSATPFSTNSSTWTEKSYGRCALCCSAPGFSPASISPGQPRALRQPTAITAYCRHPVRAVRASDKRQLNGRLGLSETLLAVAPQYVAALHFR